MSSKIFCTFIVFFFFQATVTQMQVHLLLSQRSLRLSLILFILCSLFSSSAVISNILSSTSLIHCSASVILLLNLSTVFLISVIVFFVSVCFLFISCRSLLSVLNQPCIFSILFSKFWIIFTIFTLNSFSGSFPLFSLFIWSCGCLPCSFTHKIFLYLFILSSFSWICIFLSSGQRFQPVLTWFSARSSASEDVFFMHLW